MIYIKKFLYLLYIIAMTIIGAVIFFTTIIAYPFIAMVDYIVHGKITKNYYMIFSKLYYKVLNKFTKPK